MVSQGGTEAQGIDVHQHLWPEPFVAALHRRRSPPRLRGRGGRPTLDMLHEPTCTIDLTAHQPAVRLAALDRLGVATAVVSISTPVGCEALPADEAAPLVDAFNDGIAELVAGSGGRLRAFAAVAVSDPGAAADDLERRLNQGFVGVSLPSGALETASGVTALEPVLAVLERRGGTLFVHPGPGPATRPDETGNGLPGLWTSLAGYPASAQRAFFTWRATGERRRIRVVWAIMAGGAPFLEGRWRTFAGRPGEIDPHQFFDTASAGRESLELLLATYGVEQVVFGTDHPVIDWTTVRSAVHALGAGVVELVAGRNPARALDLNGGG
ncbi:MAG: amidohydrolase family protein [Gaiellales bacterium]